ncbi:unnamed protein product [Symbiodinium microadriaticum]|nr:unnamed protein product [Symbiodinium microadriaticum]
MLGFLEEKIELAHSYGDKKWSALLGSWLVAAGCLRYRHLQCARFSSGWSWTEAWLRDWRALSPTAKKRAGLCFNRAGRPWAISEINLSAQEAFREMLQEPADMTTYRWRRLLPTMGQLLRLSPQEQLALGDWASNNPEGNQMPLHYSSARYTTSLRRKALSLPAAWEVRGLEDWSAVTDTELGRIKGAVQSQVDDVVGDRTTIFQAPEQVGKMPATLNGKVLTAFLKNGQSLCAGFQLGRCRLEEKDCASAHRCAVALRSGPACGGNHPAEICYDKRALLAQTAKEPGPSGGTGQAILPQRRAASVPEPVGPSPKRAKQHLPAVAFPSVGCRGLGRSSFLTGFFARNIGRRARQLLSAGGGEEARARESWHNYYDRLATAGGKTAEAPTVIWQSGSGGRLFLSGLPTSATPQYFPKVSLQVTCFDKTPEQRGEHVLFHCMAGRHRAATLTRSLLAFESLPDALEFLKSVRNAEPEKVLSERGVGDFVHRMRRTISIGRAAPTPTAYLATASSNVHVAAHDIPLCKHNQSTSKALRLKDAWSTSDREEAVGWGIRFCKACLRLSPASASWHLR